MNDLIDAFLLKKADARFPLPDGVQNEPPGAFQHHCIGRGYPESRSDDDA